MPLALPFDPTSSVQATRLAWAIERFAEGDLTPEQIEATHEFDPGYGVETHLRRFKIFRRPIDEVIAYDLVSDHPLAEVRSGQDAAVVMVRLGEEPERRIIAMSLIKRPAPGVTTRLAIDADAPALRDLERRCPVETGDVSVYYDRGDDYFAQQRLMGSHITSIAEYDGRIVGVISDSIRRIAVAGAEYRATYRFHLRVDPAARGLNIFPALNFSQSLYVFAERPLPIPSVFVAAGNAQVTAATGPEQNASRWITPIERIVISCHTYAGETAGRPSQPDDAARIAHILAESHGAEELALDFNENWVNQRLGRSKLDYSWQEVILTDHAVLGVWDSGLRIVRADASGTTATRTATALDWGFTPGAESEMASLLRSTCSRLAADGVEDLVMFSSPRSPGRDFIAGFARVIEPYFVNTSGVLPSKDATHGVYVDPVYF